MKKFYTPLLALFSVATFAQQTISFEESEGYSLGTIHQQNGWEVTEAASSGFVTNQTISDEQASEDTFSFKNGYEPTFDWQFYPIFGTTKLFETPADFSNFTISYDVLVSALNGSDFEFTLFADNDMPVAGVGMDFVGEIYLITDEDYGHVYAETTYEANEWVNVRIEVTTEEIKYYINNVLEATTPTFTQSEIIGFNMLHNNFEFDAYYDNFVITTNALSTSDRQLSNLAIYPNPANNVISISTPENTEISDVAIFDLLSKKVLSSTQTQNINISDLAPGTYLLKASTINGSSITKKIVKK